MAIRTKFQALLAKIESTPGVDASPVAGSDALACENIRITGNPNVINTNEYTGTIDSLAPIVGGMPFQITFDVPVKGSGTAGTPPEFGKLLKACGMAETITASAIGASAQAATAGTANTATGGLNFTATAQLYRGMPLLLAGNPAAGDILPIADYTAGKVFTLPKSFSPSLDTSTTLQIPINVLYAPASNSIPALTFYRYKDGKLLKLFGGRGSWRLAGKSGDIFRFSFTFLCMFGAESDTAMISPTLQATRPVAWKGSTGGAMFMNKLAIPLTDFSLDSGINPVQPDNPNAAEGFDVAEIVARNLTGQINPVERLVAVDDVMTDFRSGNARMIAAKVGTVAGNRFGVVVPAALYTGDNEEDRSGIAGVTVPFAATGLESGAFLYFA